jgi:hypothetical protein
MFFVAAKGPQTMTSDGVERWHTLDETENEQKAEGRWERWKRTLGNDHDLKLVSVVFGRSSDIYHHIRNSVEQSA